MVDDPAFEFTEADEYPRWGDISPEEIRPAVSAILGEIRRMEASSVRHPKDAEYNAAYNSGLRQALVKLAKVVSV